VPKNTTPIKRCYICGDHNLREMMKAAVKLPPICWVCFRLKATVDKEALVTEQHMKDEEARA